jgi:hypothetical protein
MSFTEKLDPEALAYFNNVAQKPFSQQAVAFLNAYWPEVHDQAEFIFTVAWEVIKYADMHCKGISLRHLYEEGHDLDFDIASTSTSSCASSWRTPRTASGPRLPTSPRSPP